MSSNNFVRSVIGNDNKKAHRKDKYLSKTEDWRFQLARVMLTGVFKNQFYRSADAAVQEALKIAPKAAKEDPQFLLKASCFARSINMKGMVKVGLAALNGHADVGFLSRESTRAAAVGLLSTFHPGQLLQFVELVKSKKLGRGFGSRPQKWVRAAMENWDANKVELYTLKYPKAFNALVRLVHPRFRDSRGGLVNYVLDNKKRVTGSKQLVVESLKGGVNKSSYSAKEVAKTILEHDIPWDVVKGIGYKMTDDLAMAQMVQMGLTALLLNIRSLEQHGVFNTSNGMKALKLKMNEVKNGRAIPLDFAKPYIFASNQKVKDILLDAMVDTLSVPIPAIEGKRVGLSIDISGSMSGEMLQTAGLLSIPFLKSRDLWFTTFDTQLHEEGSRAYSPWYRGEARGSVCPILKGKSSREQVRALLNLRTNGGTDISQPVLGAIKQNRKLDLMVIVTDEQQNTGTPLMRAWKQYKAKVNSNAELWIINATNYEWSACDFKDPSVTVYQSLTPAIFRNLKFAGIDLVSAIDEFDISGTRKRAYPKNS